MGAGIVQIDRFSAPKAWLDQIGQNAGPASGRARLFTLLDGLAAVGFAAGLAFGIDAIAARRGALALSLWLLLAIVAMVARGLLARAAGTAGARAAAQAKAGVRANLARAV